MQKRKGAATDGDEWDLEGQADSPKAKGFRRRPWYVFWQLRPALFVGFWALVFGAGELGAPRVAVHSCTWAHPDATEYRLAVVADPQLTDYYSYGMPRGSWTLALTEFYSDLYMRRNFQQIARMRPAPDGVIVLGDIFDGGRVLDAHARTDHRRRFNWIFQTPQPIQFWNMTGNHDVGIKQWYSADAAAAFAAFFGASQYTAVLGHVEVVVVDTIALLSNDDAVRAVALDFVRALGATASTAQPRLLFTHVPLFRPDHGATCGPARQSRPIRQGEGVSYQNVVSQELTAFILDMVRPVHIFSGDDHTHCTYTHPQGITEDTLATFSWLQGERHPEFAMLSLHGSSRSTTAAHITMCPLSDQMGIYFQYAYFGAASVVYLVLSDTRPLQAQLGVASRVVACFLLLSAVVACYFVALGLSLV
ncbi:hypothetical protein ACHHYP_07308 [Achlya hypogyna]|uniref:Uncharacterized protein n=1 Tax=Achlya hypogyna TaxID=1202772 RepID=A0A1V9YQY4_ACHHY|nr:hypothetical protein ACHHYP_07308 [Achlya hypogyna]